MRMKKRSHLKERKSFIRLNVIEMVEEKSEALVIRETPAPLKEFESRLEATAVNIFFTTFKTFVVSTLFHSLCLFFVSTSI